LTHQLQFDSFLRVTSSPELETLDQLLGGDLSLAIIRTLYPNDEGFNQAMISLLREGDVVLLSATGAHIPPWRHTELFANPSVSIGPDTLKLRITEKGARKIA
jgi:hypothetical protein